MFSRLFSMLLENIFRRNGSRDYDFRFLFSSLKSGSLRPEFFYHCSRVSSSSFGSDCCSSWDCVFRR